MFSLPNLLTAMNLVCGITSIIATIAGRIDISPLFLFAAMGFDFLDGFAARKLAIQSELGKQLDSLADMVSFGLAPGIIVMVMIILGVHDGTIAPHDYNYQATSYTWFQIQAWMQAVFYNVPNQFDASIKYLPFIAFIIPVLSLFRLAKFNIDDKQSDRFIGVPTPLNTIFILFFPLYFCYHFSTWNSQHSLMLMVFDCYSIACITGLFSFLLIANIPLIALKFKSYAWAENKYRYLLLLLSLISFIVFFLWAIPIIVILYLLLSLIENRQNKTNEI
jgi:CDP-diacylglycerol--serine O-phosphatidyltransferase